VKPRYPWQPPDRLLRLKPASPVAQSVALATHIESGYHDPNSMILRALKVRERAIAEGRIPKSE
jgi:hypothetical protein